MKSKSRKLTKEETTVLLGILKTRFEQHKNRHKQVKWEEVEAKLQTNAGTLSVLQEMEDTGGEPDVVAIGKTGKELIFCDCSSESPKGRRSICYDPEALASRKEHKPANSAIGMAADMGVELLTEEEYRRLQTFGTFDQKTSSWVQTPANIRKLGGALFCDRRYDTVFVYHNGAESYYAARGFRGKLSL